MKTVQELKLCKELQCVWVEQGRYVCPDPPVHFGHLTPRVANVDGL